MLQPIAEGVWAVSAVLPMPMFVRFPIRMTVLRAEDGALVLVSPVALSDAQAAAIDALGEVRLIVAPSLLHHLFAGAAKARWPRARLVGPEGLARKRPELARDADLQDGPLAPGISALALHGAPRIGEFLVYHARSRTLVVTDLVFNVRRGVSWATRLVFTWVAGTFGRLAPSRMWRWAVRDRRAFRASLERALALDSVRLVVAHGELVERDARAELGAALAPFLR